jgi:hypothetical protein
MDIKLYVSVLRMHSEHLCKLSTALREKLDDPEQHFAEEENLGELNAASALQGMAELNNSLFAATDLFYHRLYLFLSDTTRETRERPVRADLATQLLLPRPPSLP